MTEEGPGAGFPENLGQYRLVRRLGAGGMGTVFEAIDRRVEMRVAVKLLHPHLAADASYRERFEREAHVAALLRSPYTAQLLDYGLDHGYYYLVMQFVDGHTVADELRTGPMRPARALTIAADVARALEEAEARGVVHRDIKPENILLGNDQSVKVADFGIARQTYSSGVTIPGGFVGTSAFAAPEQADGTVDTRTGIYALGGTLFTMLTGHAPFSGSPLELMRQHRETPPPVGELARFPTMVGQVVAKCLAKRPLQRYQRPSELAGALERALHDVENASVIPQTSTMVVAPGMPGATEQTGGTREAPAGPAGTVVAPAPVFSGSGVMMSSVGGPLRMELKPQTSSVGSRTGATAYTLLLQSQLQQQTEVALRFDDPSGTVDFEMPAAISVPPMGSSVVSVRVKPKKRRWFGTKVPRIFMVTADGSNGGVPPISATGQMDDLPLGPFLLGGGVVGALAIAAFAGVGAASFLGGGDDNPPVSPTEENGGGGGGERTPTRESTRQTSGRTTIPAPSGTSVVIDDTPTPTVEAATATATIPPPPPPATPTATTAAGPPANSANAGEWTITLNVTYNDCPFGQFVGGQIEETYGFYEVVSDDSFMEPGEAIDAYQTRTDAYLGQYTFSYPLWSISYDVVATDGSPGTAWLYNSFTAVDRTIGQLEEYYTTAAGQCQIIYENP